MPPLSFAVDLSQPNPLLLLLLLGIFDANMGHIATILRVLGNCHMSFETCPTLVQNV